MGRKEEKGKEDEEFLLGVVEQPSDDSRASSRSATNGSAAVSWRSLPNKRQLLFLGICRLSEPLSNTALLAYVYYLLKSVLSTSDSTPSDAQISRHSGVLIAAFPLAQFATSLLWGYLSDIHGRKPIIVIGLVLSIFANLGFGFSRSFGALVFWRALAGLANGNTSVMRTMTAEIVKERKYQARAFLLLPLIFNTGRVLALAMGGCLADPVVNLPSFFGPEGFFNGARNPGGVAWAMEYRYALQPIMNVAVLTISLMLAVFGLRETFPGKQERTTFGPTFGKTFLSGIRRIIRPQPSTKYSALKFDDESPDPPEYRSTSHQHRPPFSRIWTRDVIMAMVSSGLLPLHNNSFTHLFPLFLSSPSSPPTDDKHAFTSLNGGLALSSKSVGLCLSILGVSGIVFKFLTYPYLQSRFGTLKVFRLALHLFPIAYLCAPLLSLLHEDSVLRWLCISLVLCTQIIARGFAIPSAVILLTDASPSKSVLGTVHGAGNMLASLARAVGPMVGGLVFAWGMEKGYGGTAWWVWLTPISIVALVWSYIMTTAEDKLDEREIEMR